MQKEEATQLYQVLYKILGVFWGENSVNIGCSIKGYLPI